MPVRIESSSSVWGFSGGAHDGLMRHVVVVCVVCGSSWVVMAPRVLFANQVRRAGRGQPIPFLLPCMCVASLVPVDHSLRVMKFHPRNHV